MPPKKRSKRRGSQETERISTRARSQEVAELNCVPETQQAAGVEELVVGVEDPLKMSDTEQGDIGLQTQHESDTSDEDTQDTQAAAATTQKGKGTDKSKADKRSKKPPVLFSAEQERKLEDFLRDNEILCNKRLMDYKDRSKMEAVWAKFCEENNLDKDACQKWFQNQRTLFGKVTNIKSGQGEPVLTERQKWTRDNFDFLRALRHLAPGYKCTYDPTACCQCDIKFSRFRPPSSSC